MSFRPTLLLLTCLVTVPIAAEAQFSMDIPGVPRARVPFLSGGTGRFEVDLTAYRLRGEDADTLAGSFRMGFGHSWRLGSRFELGYDVSLAEVRAISPGTPEGQSAGDPTQIGGTAAYGARFGLKFQPYSIADPDGYGVSAAMGVAYQPELKPVFAYSKVGGSVTTGGYAGDRPSEGELEPMLTATGTVMGALSYRSPRIEVDAAVTHTRSNEPSGYGITPSFDGTAFASGARFYLTQSFGLGAAYWGSGPPPWRDRVALGLRGSTSADYGLMLTFGGGLERGTDIMISSPTGSFSESISLYLRTH